MNYRKKESYLRYIMNFLRDKIKNMSLGVALGYLFMFLYGAFLVHSLVTKYRGGGNHKTDKEAVVVHKDPEKGTIKAHTAITETSEDHHEFNESLVAHHNGRTAKVRVGNYKVPNITNSDQKEGDYKTPSYKYDNEIDVSDLVEPLIPKWEAGIGIGTHKGDHYIPFSIQRDYDEDKALRVELHVKPYGPHRGLNGFEVQHIWKW